MFLDAIESVNVLVRGVFIYLRIIIDRILQVNADGTVMRSEILGVIRMKCYLSGMPELKLGLNDKIMFDQTAKSELDLCSLYQSRVSDFVFSRPGKSHRDGRCKFSSMRALITVRSRPYNILHSSRR